MGRRLQVTISPSVLFKVTWEGLGGPPLEKEYKFHKKRQWRADYAHIPSRTLIEIEGGVWIRGRHIRPQGFMKDIEKYTTATLEGWTVFRLSPNMIDNIWVPKLIKFCKENAREQSQTDRT